MIEESDMVNLLPPEPVQAGGQRIRWFLLFIFVCFSVANSFQSTQYSIIEDIIQQYFSVQEWAVDLTVTVFMIVYVPFIHCAMCYLEDKGLRRTIILGSLGTAIGAWIKVFTVKRNLFWASFVGQSIVAAAQVFMLSIPPVLAAVWFGPEEVSLACAIGVFGNMLGSAIGFYLPPIFCQHHDTPKQIESGLWLMFIITAGFSTLVFFLAYIFFKDNPPSSQQRTLSREERRLRSLLKRLCRNKNYMLLLIVFTINQGVYNAVSTLLTELILPYFKGGEIFSGDIGLVSVVASMVASLVLGYIVNKTHKFRAVALGSFILSFLGMIAFTGSLITCNQPAVYAASILMGFFLGGYMTLAIDFGVELSYPEPESLTTGVLTAPGQLVGFIFTMACDKVITTWGPLQANISMCAVLLLGVFLHVFIKSDLRRQAANARLRPDSQNKENLSNVQIGEGLRTNVQTESTVSDVQNEEALESDVQNEAAEV